MKLKIILLCLLSFIITGCEEGPAENAGEQLDSAVAEAREEVGSLNRQIQEYKQKIEQMRNELTSTKDQLIQSKEELVEVRKTRQKLINEIEAFQEKSKSLENMSKEDNPAEN